MSWRHSLRVSRMSGPASEGSLTLLLLDLTMAGSLQSFTVGVWIHKKTCGCQWQCLLLHVWSWIEFPKCPPSWDLRCTISTVAQSRVYSPGPERWQLGETARQWRRQP